MKDLSCNEDPAESSKFLKFGCKVAHHELRTGGHKDVIPLVQVGSDRQLGIAEWSGNRKKHSGLVDAYSGYEVPCGVDHEVDWKVEVVDSELL